MRIYILEDMSIRMEWFRKTFHDCEIYHTDKVKKACEDIENNEYDLIFLDRDLGDYKLTGEFVTDYMVEKRLAQNSAIVIHSSNEPARIRMKENLDVYHKDVHIIPFTELYNMKREDFKCHQK